MRVVLATALSLMLAAAPALGADALKPHAGFFQDGKQVMVLVPADRLDAIHRELANAQGAGRDVMIVMPFEQFARVVDMAAIDSKLSGQIAAGSSETSTSTAPSREQTSAQSSESSGSVSYGFFDNKAILLVPYDQLQSLGQAGAGDRVLVVMPYDKFHQVADLTKLDPTQAASSTSPSREQTSASQSGMSADRFAWSDFHRNHVMLLVPADQLKSFSTISTSGDQPIYVLMPLEQFNRVADVKTSMTESSTMAATPGREQTSFQPPSSSATTTTALPPAYPDRSRTFFLHNLQEANSVLHWFPAAGGTIITLRDGSQLLVPDSVQIRGALQEGARIRGEYEQRDGQNLVTWLEVIDLTNNN